VYASTAKWDRHELYQKVWEFPLRKLAEEYGVSDVGLAKVCRKLHIPLPGLGHWTKIACGHKIPRPPLPEVNDLPILIRHIRKPETPLLPEDSPELEKMARIAAGAVPAVAKAMLGHPLIQKTKAVLNGARTNDRGILWAGREVDWLDLRVSKDCLPRALGIMAALIHMLEQEGFQVVVEKKTSESTSAIVCGEQIRFGVIERSRQIKSAAVSGSSGYVYNSIRLEPTGMLSIEVWNYYSGGPQKAWRDRDSMRVEEQLPRCVAGMMRIALKQRAERRAREEEELARQTKIDEVTAELRQIEAEEKKIRALKKEAVLWHRAERIRKYVAVVREDAQRKSDQGERNKILEWVEWAERQADRIDPLKESPRSIVDDKTDVLRRLRSAERWW
jgi:hypothetical protein